MASAQLNRALDMGVDIVAAFPFRTDDGRRYSFGRGALQDRRRSRSPVDIHCDETDDPLSRHVETLQHKPFVSGLEGRVAGSHLTSMHSMDNYYVSKLIPLMVEARINVIPNPLINIMLQGRHDTYPRASRHDTCSRTDGRRAQRLLRARLRHDPWYSMGSGDMLEVGHMAIHVAQMAGIEDKKKIFDALTVIRTTLPA